MANMRPLSELKKIDIDALTAKLTSESKRESEEAGLTLARDAASFGLGVKDYLKLAVGKEADKVNGLNGYELALYKLNLPVRNDFENGVYLQAASETFQTHPGTRALFPEVIDDVLRFATRQDQIEQVGPLLANSRTVAGVELLSTVIDDDSEERDSFSVAEMGRIPIRTIKTSEKSVKFYKHGSAIRTSYEFSRRASLDLLVPHANRVARELERSKLTVATGVLINGDGAYDAAPSVNQSSYNAATGFTATSGKINWPHFMYWLIQRAKAGVPIDTVVMNWDGWFQWLLMFSEELQGVDNKSYGARAVENLAAAGVAMDKMPAAVSLVMNITPVLSSAMPANKLLGFSKGDTLEELVEAGSNIQETERAILSQTMTMVRTENTGYRLVYGDTRSIFVFNA
jgi:hypothetical protein